MKIGQTAGMQKAISVFSKKEKKKEKKMREEEEEEEDGDSSRRKWLKFMMTAPDGWR